MTNSPVLPVDDTTHLPEDSYAPDRLRLIGNRAPAEHIDGAWWPASKDLARELPTLLAAVSDQVSRVAVVGYRRDGWIAPSQLELGGSEPVDLLGFVSDEPATIVLVGDDGHHLTLRVIAPDTDEHQARRSLEEIPRRVGAVARPNLAASRSVAEVAKKLADHEGRRNAARTAEILRWCQDAAAQFDAARIQTFVPILVEHIVNNRIHQERRDAQLHDRESLTERQND